MVTAIIILSIIGLISATLLYIISRKFHVEEDSRIDEIESILPGANCGGCGYAGCRNFAEPVSYKQLTLPPNELM